MKPYGIKKERGGIHSHERCAICSGEPPFSNTTPRREAKEAITKDLEEYKQESTMQFKISETELKRAHDWLNTHDCKDPVTPETHLSYPFRSSIGGGSYFCFEPTGLYTSFFIQCICGGRSKELNDPMDL